MKKPYNVYQQQRPEATGKTVSYKDAKGVSMSTKEYQSNLVYVGRVEAHSGSNAIDVARKTMKEFISASRQTLGAFPIVEQVAEREPIARGIAVH